jgi:hypothetical protein
MDNTVGRLQSLLLPDQFDLIVGSLLGDARLECRSKGVRHPVSARLRIQQSEKQKEYVWWKYHILKDVVLRGPRRILVSRDALRNAVHHSWYFHTKTVEWLGPLYHLFYRKGVKQFPSEIVPYLTPRAIAIWFMDDGSNVGGSYTLSTHNFSFEEQERMAKFFAMQYGVHVSIVKDRSRFKLAIGKKDAPVFTEIIAPYIIPSMTYKIATPVTTSLQVCKGIG